MNLSRPREIPVFYNGEQYFQAGRRLKFKEKQNEPVTKNENIKKPRKGNRTGRTPNDKLPEKSTSTFSYSEEISRISLDTSINTWINTKHEEEIDSLQFKITSDFPRWIYMLRENFNIILHGYGSKDVILHEFKTYLNDEFFVFDINGLFPKLNPRKLLIEFWGALNLDDEIPVTGSNILALAEDIYNVLSSIEHSSIFFIVRSFERLAISQPKLFKALCSLSRVPFIHFVTTVDHFNTGLGISHSRIAELNPYWINCNTFKPYENELTWNDNAIYNENESELTTKDSLDQVLKSLTSNARKAFMILVSLQVDSIKASGKSKEFPGIQFSELSRKCREKFIAHTEMALRTLLTEFVDHKLIRYSGKGKKTDNMLIVELDLPTLEQIVAAT